MGQTPIAPIESLYVHVPFCAHKCNYCAFYSEASSGELINRYVEALVRELEIAAPDLKPKAIEKVRPVRRSAGFQPAVSPISNRQNVAMTVPQGLSGHPQAGSTAIQQVGNLRYDFVHGPVPRAPGSDVARPSRP